MIIQEECIELNKRPHRRPPRQVKLERPHILFCAFIFWTALSFTASIVVCSGYWLPYWIRGSYHQAIDVSFGSFRRCNYPHLDDQGRIQIIPKCGRYKNFSDIPSLPWKVTTVLVGLGATLSLLVAFTLLFCCCMPYSLTSHNARTLVFIQIFSFLLTVSGCALYPMGWAHQEVRDACGENTMPYSLGTCHLSLSVYLLSIGQLLLLFCLLFGLVSIRKLRHQTTKSYDNVVIIDRL